MDLTEAKEVKKWQEYTKEVYTKGLNDLDNHDGVVTHLEPGILECEGKWATGLEKVSFHSNPKEGQCQRMFKVLYNCAHFIC